MKAVLFTLLADGRTLTDPMEGPDCLNQIHALRESVREDFPGAIFAVGADAEATEDRAERLFANMGWDRP